MPPRKRKQSNREIAKGRERQRKARYRRMLPWGSSEVEEDVTALGLLLRSADSDQERASDSERAVNDEMLVVKERARGC